MLLFKFNKMNNLLLILFLMTFAGISAQELQPKRPGNYQPFIYEYSVEQLSRMYSEQVMVKSAGSEKEMQDKIKTSPYKLSFDKLDKHHLPNGSKMPNSEFSSTGAPG